MNRLAWHECLTPLKMPEPWTVELQAKWDEGKKLHARLEAIIGNHIEVEQEQVYREPELPFEIAYHPDVLRQEVGIQGVVQTFVYEIKPLVWYLRNRTYCDAQASGYAHFTGATDASFVLYWFSNDKDENPNLSVLPLRRIPWEQLRQVALKAYAQLETIR